MISWGMNFFCLLWIPLFTLFRLSLAPGKKDHSGSVWALLLGSAAGLVHFFCGSLIKAQGFGLSRWAYALVDITVFPAILPLLVFAAFSFFRLFSGSPDLTNFALLWLIPEGILCAIKWSVLNDPVYLVLAPLIWTACALGIPFFVHIIRDHFGILIVFAALGILAIPLAASVSFWAFFSHRLVPGFILLGVAVIPAGISLGIAGRTRKTGYT
jgi:hypothetical protein